MDGSGALLAGRYRLRQQIGAGPAATVWDAWDERLGRASTVKLLAPAAHAHTEVIRQSIFTAMSLSHPNIVTAYDWGETVAANGLPVFYVVMEHVKAITLAVRLDNGGLPWRQAAAVCAQVAAALAHAHAAGTAHGDLRPEWILLADQGVKVLGFDGTSAATDDDPGERSAADVRELGETLARCLAGQAGASLPSNVPDVLARICVRCLDPDALARPSAAAVGAWLRSASDDHDPEPPPDLLPAPEPPRESPRNRRRRILVAAIATAAIAVLILSLTIRDNPQPYAAVPPPTEASTPTATPDATSPSPSPSPTVSPSPSATHTTRPPKPSPTRTSTPPPTTTKPPAPVSRAQVLQRLRTSVNQGVAVGDIRSDVGVDLNNVITNMQNAIDSPDFHQQVLALRDKIATRLREGALTQSRANTLDSILAPLI